MERVELIEVGAAAISPSRLLLISTLITTQTRIPHLPHTNSLSPCYCINLNRVSGQKRNGWHAAGVFPEDDFVPYRRVNPCDIRGGFR